MIAKITNNKLLIKTRGKCWDYRFVLIPQFNEINLDVDWQFICDRIDFHQNDVSFSSINQNRKDFFIISTMIISDYMDEYGRPIAFYISIISDDKSEVEMIGTNFGTVIMQKLAHIIDEKLILSNYDDIEMNWNNLSSLPNIIEIESSTGSIFNHSNFKKITLQKKNLL